RCVRPDSRPVAATNVVRRRAAARYDRLRPAVPAAHGTQAAPGNKAALRAAVPLLDRVDRAAPVRIVWPDRRAATASLRPRCAARGVAAGRAFVLRCRALPKAAVRAHRPASATR